MQFDPKNLSYKELYKLMINCIVPRPIAIVGTISPAGIENLAPFSFYNGVASNPPSLSIAIVNKDNGEHKDTLKNIQLTKEFVVNSCSESMLDNITTAASAYAYEVSEYQFTSFTKLPCKLVKPSRIKESIVSFECNLLNYLKVGDGSAGSATLVVGEIKYIHIQDDCIKDLVVDFDKLNPLSRLGGISYGVVKKKYEKAVPKL